MIFLILLVVLILNAACIYLMYRFLGKTQVKQKVIFIAAGVAVMYLLTLLVYWISTHNLSEVYTTGTAKDLVIFMFVPINGLVVLPLLAVSYDNYREKKLEKKTFIKRGLLVLIPLIIVLVCEAFLLKNVQILVTSAIDSSSSSTTTEYEGDEQIEEDTLDEETEENEVSDEETDEEADETTDEETEIEEDDAVSDEETTEDTEDVVEEE